MATFSVDKRGTRAVRPTTWPVCLSQWMDRYFTGKGVLPKILDQVVGPDLELESLNSVDDEDYHSIELQTTNGSWTLNSAGGKTAVRAR